VLQQFQRIWDVVLSQKVLMSVSVKMRWHPTDATQMFETSNIKQFERLKRKSDWNQTVSKTGVNTLSPNFHFLA
jgi:hypothetical protein